MRYVSKGNRSEPDVTRQDGEFCCPTKGNVVVLGVGFGLILFLALITVVSALWSFLNITCNSAVLILSFVFAVGLVRYLLDANTEETLIATFVIILLVVCCLTVASLFVDVSFDGNAYHKLGVVSLAEGWNPIRGSVAEWEHFNRVADYTALYVDCYSQGVWRIEAALYSITGKLETAKSATLLMAAGSSFVLGAYLRFRGLRVWQSIAIGAVAFMNPIVIAQFVTFYVDAFLMMALLGLIVGLIMLNDRVCARWTSASLVLVASSLVLSSAAKFTGLVYAGAFMLAFWALFIVVTKIQKKTPARISIGGLTLAFFIMVTFVVFVVNYSPFITNMINHGDPLYPLRGEGAVDIITPNTPKDFLGKPSIVAVLLSVFSEVSNPVASDGQIISLRLPLMFDAEELYMLRVCDLRVNGYGVLYSFIFILLCVGTIWAFVVARKQNKFFVAVYLTFLVPMFGLMLFLEAGWWARYTPYTYFTTFFVLYFLFSQWNTRKGGVKIAAKILSCLLLIAIAVNSSLFLAYNTGYAWEVSRDYEKAIDSLQSAVDEGAKLSVYLTRESAHAYALEERGIEFNITKESSGEVFEPQGNIWALRYRLDWPDS